MTTGRITSQSGQNLRQAYASGRTAVYAGDTNHYDTRYREYITRMMEDELRDAGVTDVFLEQPDTMQPYVQRFMAARTAEEETRVLNDMARATGLGLREDHQRMFAALKRQNELARANGQPEIRAHFMDTRLTEEETRALAVVTQYQQNPQYRHNGNFDRQLVPEPDRTTYLASHRILFAQRERVNTHWADRMAAVHRQNQAEGRPSRLLAFAGDGHASRRYDAALAADPLHRDHTLNVSHYEKDVNELLQDRGISTEYWRLQRTDNYTYYTGGTLNPGNDKTVIFGERRYVSARASSNDDTPDHIVYIPDQATFDAERLRRSREAPPLLPEERARAEEARRLLIEMRRSSSQCQLKLVNGNTCPSMAINGSERLSNAARGQLDDLTHRAVPGFRTFACAVRADDTSVLEYDVNGIARLDDRQLIQLLPVIRETKRCCEAATRGETVTVQESAVLSGITSARALTRNGESQPVSGPTTTPGTAPDPAAPAAPGGTTTTPPQQREGSGIGAYMPMIMAGIGGIAGVAFGGFNMQGLLIGLALAAVGGGVGGMMFSNRSSSTVAAAPAPTPQPVHTGQQVQPEAQPQSPGQTREYRVPAGGGGFSSVLTQAEEVRAAGSVAAQVEHVRLASVAGPIEDVGAVPAGYTPTGTPVLPPTPGLRKPGPVQQDR